MSLRLADLGPSGWRLVYVVSLVWLIVAADLARRLPETKRFIAHQRDVVRHHLDRHRLVALSAAAFAGNLFVAPASFFQNRYLEEVRGYSGGGIALFTITTATPAGIGILIGGRLADHYGRRILGSVSLVVGTAVFLCSFGVAGRADVVRGDVRRPDPRHGRACSRRVPQRAVPDRGTQPRRLHGHGRGAPRRQHRRADHRPVARPRREPLRGAQRLRPRSARRRGDRAPGVPGDRPSRARRHQPGGPDHRRRAQPRRDRSDDLFVGAAEIVPGTVDPDVRDRTGDRLARRLDLVRRAERVPRAMDEQARQVELRQVLGRAAGRGGRAGGADRTAARGHGRAARRRPPSNRSAHPSIDHRARGGRHGCRARATSAAASVRTDSSSTGGRSGAFLPALR